MWFRRAVYVSLFPVAVILPLWVLVSRGVLANELGWQFLVYLFACPFLFVVMSVISAFVAFRKSSRSARAVSWTDAAILVALDLAVIAMGLFSTPLVVALVIALSIAAFWVTLWELGRETRKRFNGFVDGLEASGRRAAATPSSVIPPSSGQTILIERGGDQSR
jgi:hypothetical protein